MEKGRFIIGKSKMCLEKNDICSTNFAEKMNKSQNMIHTGGNSGIGDNIRDRERIKMEMEYIKSDRALTLSLRC